MTGAEHVASAPLDCMGPLMEYGDAIIVDELRSVELRGSHPEIYDREIVLLEGRLVVNGKVIGPGSYCHFPAGEPMVHAPADDQPCLFVTIFPGPSELEPLDD